MPQDLTNHGYFSRAMQGAGAQQPQQQQGQGGDLFAPMFGQAAPAPQHSTNPFVPVPPMPGGGKPTPGRTWEGSTGRETNPYPWGPGGRNPGWEPVDPNTGRPLPPDPGRGGYGPGRPGLPTPRPVEPTPQPWSPIPQGGSQGFSGDPGWYDPDGRTNPQIGDAWSGNLHANPVGNPQYRISGGSFIPGSTYR